MLDRHGRRWNAHRHARVDRLARIAHAPLVPLPPPPPPVSDALLLHRPWRLAQRRSPISFVPQRLPPAHTNIHTTLQAGAAARAQHEPPRRRFRAGPTRARRSRLAPPARLRERGAGRRVPRCAVLTALLPSAFKGRKLAGVRRRVLLPRRTCIVWRPVRPPQPASERTRCHAAVAPAGGLIPTVPTHKQNPITRRTPPPARRRAAAETRGARGFCGTPGAAGGGALRPLPGGWAAGPPISRGGAWPLCSPQAGGRWHRAQQAPRSAAALQTPIVPRLYN